MSSSIIASVVTGGTNSAQTVAEELNNVATDFVSQGVVGTFTSGSPNTGAFGVTQNTGSDMAVTILSGRAYVSGTPTGQDAQVLSARMTANYTGYTINANSTGSTRYDWIYLSLSATNANTPSSAKDNVITLVTSRSTSNATDNGSPPTYGLLLGVVTVTNGASAITNGNITDKRVQSLLSVQSAATTGWQNLSNALTYGANNGNKEFTVTTPSDITGTLSPGMKLKITRSVTPPSQCMAFTAASSQYYSTTSPTGITFTAAFTCEAWVYLNSYTGSVNTVIRRFASGNGFGFRINATGQVDAFFSSASATTEAASDQSIPIKRWVHVAATVTVASKTISIYINGTQVPVFASSTAATALTQGGNLFVGANETPGEYFDGYISELRLWSVAQSTANIQANMAINLVGNETNLVGLWQGSGNANDATSNLNNLTATNGAKATQANNPYNGTEYATVRAVSYSNPTTTVTLYTSDAGAIPNQTLNSPQYSTAKSPFGLPEILNSRILSQIIWCANLTTTATATGTQLAGATTAMTIPSNGKLIVVKALAQSMTPGAGIAVLQGFWNSTQIGQYNTSNNAGVTMVSAPTLVPAGSQTFSLDMYETSAGTCTLNGSITAPIVFTVEEA